jgi:hypothetical protein
MLKALIQLFAEKFLQNKSEWVGNQAMPITNTANQIKFTPTNLDSFYTAPSDGYIALYTRNYTWSKLNNGDRAVLSSSSGTTYCHLQMAAAKGTRINYEIKNSNGGNTEAVISFTPTIGT